MKGVKNILLSLFYKLHVRALISILNYRFNYILFSSTFRKKREINDSLTSTKKHLLKGVDWLLYQQRLQPDGGISSHITFFGKTTIGGSYPEVTGYIIPTLFDVSNLFNLKELKEPAIVAADFELVQQNSEGYFLGGMVGKLTEPSVFNTAQVIDGLVRTYKETDDKKYLDSAIKAANWIISVQENDGSWAKYNYLGMKRVYDAKVCEALLKTGNVSNSEKYLESVNKNLDFILLNQKQNGWFYNCDNSYDKNDAPLTHTIAYTVQGLIECYSIIKRKDLLESAKRTLDILLHRFELDKKPLAGRFYSNWKPAVKSTCITGDAQISICWMDLYQITKDYRYLNASLKMNDFLKFYQHSTKDKMIDGSLNGSFPFWGDYCPYSINSWGVKYFIDALTKEYMIKKELENISK